MPLASIDKFAASVERLYLKHDNAVHAPIAEMLHKFPKFRKSIDDYLTKMLKHARGAAVNDAVLRRTQEVIIDVDMSKAAQSFWGRLSAPAQEQVPVEHVRIAMELLLETSGYEVVNHTFHFDLLIPDEEDLEEETPAPEPEIDPEIPRIESVTSVPSLDDEDGEEEEIVEEAPTPEPPAPKPAAKKPAKKPAAKKPAKKPTTKPEST